MHFKLSKSFENFVVSNSKALTSFMPILTGLCTPKVVGHKTDFRLDLILPLVLYL